jgi:hypothetical protein
MTDDEMKVFEVIMTLEGGRTMTGRRHYNYFKYESSAVEEVE